MAEPASVDLSALIESRKPGGFAIRLIVVSWLVTFFDGYDMNVIAFTSKALQHGFHLDEAQLGYVFTAGTAGLFLGGFLFGFIGDRFGRRPAIILATSAFSLLTIAFAFSSSLPMLLATRFLNGLALGGAIPLIWALNVEFVPRQRRATVVTLIMLGYGIGVSAAGPIARLILPRREWPGVFIFGGLASLVATGLLIAFLPESLRYLATRGGRSGAIRRILARMGFTQSFPEGARFVLLDEGGPARKAFRLSQLFEGPLKQITPLLWLAYIFSSTSTFFVSSWGPRILEDLGFGANGAAWISSVNSLCGATGGLLLMRFTDRHGAVSICVLPIVAVPLLLIAGLAPMSLSMFLPLAVLIALFLGGSHYGMTSIVSLFYPSRVRANGAGWASSMAKIGSMIGPLVGGFVLNSGVHVKTTYALLAVCPAVYASCVLAIGLIERRTRARLEAQGPAEEVLLAPVAE